MTRLPVGRVMQGHMALWRCGAPGRATSLAVSGTAANMLERHRTLKKSKSAASERLNVKCCLLM